MPLKPQKPCSKMGCPNLTRERFCPQHEKEYRQQADKERLPSHERGYDSRWHKVRKMKLSRYPLCERCRSTGIDRVATLVHHKDKNPKNNYMENLESMCERCHDEEHKADVWGRNNTRERRDNDG